MYRGISFTPVITADYILSKVSEEEVFSAYGVPVREGLFRSPLRVDRHPTCRFYRRGRRLILHDFAGYFNGDCFDLVQKVLHCNFNDALYDIARKFSIISGEPRHPAASSIIIGPRTLCDLRIRSAPWDEQHLSWWARYGVTDLATLEHYKVVPVERVWLNKVIFYNRDYVRKREVVFAYKFGLTDYKVYFPERPRDKIRFLHNNPDLLQGYPQLPEEGPLVVITKSMKDVICLSLFGIPAIAPMSETSTVTDSTLESLVENFDNIFALYDRERAGYCTLLNLRSRGVRPLMMPVRYGVKDFSDLCKKDFEAARSLVNEFLSFYKISLV